MKEVELRARALAAASAARFAGFFETAEALIAIADHSARVREPENYGFSEKDSAGWFRERTSRDRTTLVRLL